MIGLECFAADCAKQAAPRCFLSHGVDISIGQLISVMVDKDSYCFCLYAFIKRVLSRLVLALVQFIQGTAPT